MCLGLPKGLRFTGFSMYPNSIYLGLNVPIWVFYGQGILLWIHVPLMRPWDYYVFRIEPLAWCAVFVLGARSCKMRTVRLLGNHTVEAELHRECATAPQRFDPFHLLHNPSSTCFSFSISWMSLASFLLGTLTRSSASVFG